jgi:hypothetical protein
MGRTKRNDPPTLVRAYLPKSVYEKVEHQLYSELEGRVPYGAMTNLFRDLAVAWLRERGVEV